MINENGFTLIEIIVSLIIVGIMVSVVGMLMVLGVQEYVFSKENISIAQKALLAMNRIERELQELTDIDAANSDGSCIIYKLETVSPFYRAIGINGSNLELKISSNSDCDCSCTGNTLVDQVAGFLLEYEDSSGEPSTFSSTPPSQLSDLSEVRVKFELDLDSSNTTKIFDIRVNPRNNGNLNGPGVAL